MSDSITDKQAQDILDAAEGHFMAIGAWHGVTLNAKDGQVFISHTRKVDGRIVYDTRELNIIPF